MQSMLLNCVLLIVLLAYFSATSLAGDAHVRYAHTVPQFGRCNVTTSLTNVLFDLVRPGTVSRYKSLDADVAVNFTSTFQRGGSATSPGPFPLTSGSSYTIYTYVAGNPAHLVNGIVPDRTNSSGGTSGGLLNGLLSANIRAGNVVNVGFSATVTGQKTLLLNSPLVTLFTNVAYGAVSSYTSISPGIWTFDYTLSPGKRQSIDMNLTSIIAPGGWYTIWMFNGGGYIISDGFGFYQTFKRGEKEQTKMRRSQTLKERALAEPAEEVKVVEGKH